MSAWTKSALTLLLVVVVTVPVAGAQERVTVGPLVASFTDGSEPLHLVESMLLVGNFLYVVHRGASEVLRYSLPGGELERATGRRGEGPGEFSWPTWLGACDDERLFVWDGMPDRVTVYDHDLTLVRTFVVPQLASGGRPVQVRCAPNGLVATYDNFVMEIPEGPYRREHQLALLPLEGGEPEMLWRVRGDERYRYSTSDGLRTFGKVQVVVGTPSGVVLGDADSWRLLEHDLEGEVVTTYALRGEQLRPITRSDLEAWWAYDLTKAEPYGEEVVGNRRRSQRETQYPEYYPPYAEALVVGEELWVQRYQAFTDPAQRWEVFALSGGAHLASLETPRGFALRAAGDSLIAGVHTDALDVETIQVYRLVR
ncbi:MAG: hypothetical protein RQ745_00405 [Longimicrobiales bacterium]|nr:hypothetical protein [Longimicrobiales bacterium]